MMATYIRLSRPVPVLHQWRSGDTKFVVSSGRSGNGLSKVIWDTPPIIWVVADCMTPAATATHYVSVLNCYRDNCVYHLCYVMYRCSAWYEYRFSPKIGHLQQHWTLLRFSGAGCWAVLSIPCFCQERLDYIDPWGPFKLDILWQSNIKWSPWNVLGVVYFWNILSSNTILPFPLANRDSCKTKSK